MRGRNQHLCFTSHKEVLCRDYSDYATLFNCIAQGIINTNSKLLSYSIMSNHVHLGAITDKSSGLVQRIRSSYTQMFNHKYGRKGQLGDPSYFQLNLEGRIHIAACLSYISRNAWHHGVCANPFDYPFSSANLYFKKSTSILPCTELTQDAARRARLVRENNVIPKSLSFDRFGQISPADIVETDIVEGYFGSYRAFDFNLHRVNYDKWKEEQLSENPDVPHIDLQTVEPLMSPDQIAAVLKKSPGWVSDVPVSDLELCRIIDNELIRQFHVSSYAHLTREQKLEICDILRDDLHYLLPDKQIARCLAIDVESVRKRMWR